jgi:inorganic pyrophosphatase/exopolyphosphatase
MISWYFLSLIGMSQFHLGFVVVQLMLMVSEVQCKNEVAVFGHLNPDTDSIATAIGYAALLRSMGINAKAYRLGKLNKETEFVLDAAGIQEPDILPSDMPEGSEVVLVDHNESE